MNRIRHMGLAGVIALLVVAPSSGVFGEVRSGRVEIETEHMGVKIRFGEPDERRIRDYYERKHRERHRYDDDDRYEDFDRRGRKGQKHKKGKKTPPGLAKKDRLPPGLQKQIERNGQLPPGLHGRLLPRELERTLPPLPERYVRVKVEGDVVILDRETSIVVDVIHDVHRLLTGHD